MGLKSLESLRNKSESSRTFAAIAITIILMAGVVFVWVYSFDLNGETLIVDRSPEYAPEEKSESLESFEDLADAIGSLGEEVSSGLGGIEEELSGLRESIVQATTSPKIATTTEEKAL